jgi:hypothetical protein
LLSYRKKEAHFEAFVPFLAFVPVVGILFPRNIARVQDGQGPN